MLGAPWMYPPDTAQTILQLGTAGLWAAGKVIVELFPSKGEQWKMWFIREKGREESGTKGQM